MRIAGLGLCSTVFLICAVSQAQNTFPASGNVGIGTTAPSQELEVANGNQEIWNPLGLTWPLTSLTQNAYIQLSQHCCGDDTAGLVRMLVYSNGLSGIDNFGQAGGLAFQTSSTDAAPTTKLVIDETGNVGIGTTNPSDPLTIVGTNNPEQLRIQSTSSGGHSWGIASFGTYSGFNPGGLGFGDYTVGNWRMYIDGLGNVGIGTTNPQAALDVKGNINISGAGGSITFPNNGGTQSVAWTGVLCGGDYAEAVNASGGKKSYEPGDVLVLTSDGKEDVAKSSEPYSTMVAGIFATKPGVVGKRQSLSKDADDLPMAMVGIVPTKVSAENGPIRRGDLLVSSSMPGFAMKGTDRSRLVGAVIGKAMGTLDSGAGTIEVLVTLQ